MLMDLATLKPALALPAACKICGGASPLYGVVDFHKCCEEPRGFRLPLSGVPIYYRRCQTCGFLFTDAFDNWSHDQFRSYIYNADYQLVDPDYRTARPSANAAIIAQLWGAIRANTRVLDYGGGNDTLCAVLRQNGFQVAITYDPIVPEHSQRPPGKFDLVTCFETLEHLPDPVAGLAALAECAGEPGLIFYSTLLQPENINDCGLGWWYVGPRNGHVSLFTRRSLALAWGHLGYKTLSLNEGVHFAFRTLPTFLAHLQSRADSLLTVPNSVPAPGSAHAA